MISIATDAAVIHDPVDSEADRAADLSVISPVAREHSPSTVDVERAVDIGMT